MKRWHKWLWDRRLTCEAGHHIRNVANIDESGSLRCEKYIDAEKRVCGNWVWLMSFRGGGNLVCSVTLDDLKRLKNLTTPSERIAYLQVFDSDDETAA